MPAMRVVINLCVLIGLAPALTHASCSRLPSGNCWVNCLQEIFDVICDNVTADMVQSDLRVFAGTNQLLRVYIWDSPTIIRLSAEVFASVADQITGVDIQDLTAMDTFPELRTMTNLERLNVWNAPALHVLALEQLPPSVRKVALNKVGITYLENDFAELSVLPNLMALVLRNVTLKGWQPGFFNVMPNVAELEISNSTVTLSEINDDIINATHMRSLRLIGNDFSGNSPERNSRFLQNVLNSLTFVSGGRELDITYNRITLDDNVMLAIQNVKAVGKILLRGNPISANDSVVRGLFRQFANLTYVDLGETTVPVVESLLSDTSQLHTVLLDRNNFSTILSEHRIFAGSGTDSLTKVDLSYNNLTELPLDGPVINDIAGAIQNLNFRGNFLHYFGDDDVDLAGRSQVMAKFVQLKYLDLSRNNLTKFYGTRLQLPALETLDIGCNQFQNVTTDFFKGLPPTVTTIKMDFCFPPRQPWLQNGVFSELRNVKSLSLTSAHLKKWIFAVFKQTLDSLKGLEALYLDDNDFSYIKTDTIPSMPSLRILSLNRNRLQSVPPNVFANLPALEELYLSGNRISSVSVANFGSLGDTQLGNLRVLDLSRNGIYRIATGAFDDLKNLTSLLIGWNKAPIQEIFQTGGKSLRYLGIRNYDIDCLKAEFFGGLPLLQWILPDSYNLLTVNPDKRLQTADLYLNSIVEACQGGLVIPDHVTYPGLENFMTVTLHDTDVGDGAQYPIITAFLPLNYCPQDDYVKRLQTIICAKAVVMSKVD